MSEPLSFIFEHGEQFRKSIRQSAKDEISGVLTGALEHVCHRFTLTSPFNATLTPMDLQQIRPLG